MKISIPTFPKAEMPVYPEPFIPPQPVFPSLVFPPMALYPAFLFDGNELNKLENNADVLDKDLIPMPFS